MERVVISNMQANPLALALVAYVHQIFELE